MKLHIIYIGGIHEKAFVELHDMRFAVAKRIEDTYDYLKSSWWGTQGEFAHRCLGSFRICRWA